MSEIGGGVDLGTLRFDARYERPVEGYDREILIRVDLLDPDQACIPNEQDRPLLESMESDIVTLAGDEALLVGVVSQRETPGRSFSTVAAARTG